MEEKLNQLFNKIQTKFGADSNKMFTILILLIFTNKDLHIPDYFRIPELQEYIDFIEQDELLYEIFNDSSV